MDAGLLEQIKESAMYSYEKTVSKLLKKDIQYQQLAQLEKEYEQKYEEIKETLAQDTVEVIDHLLNLRDREAMIYNFWVFIVGADVGMYFNGTLKQYW